MEKRWRGTLQQEDIPCPYMSLSDHLEMLGVELRATWSQTRKANGDICQTRVGNTIKQWKAGKFMLLNQRSWSLNQYCLQKMRFRPHCVDLRVQDQLLKPEEFVIHCGPHDGGLGLHNVQLKALAGLIRTLYHSLLFPIGVDAGICVSDCLGSEDN